MFLDYKNKKTEKEIIENVEIVDFDKSLKIILLKVIIYLFLKL